MPIPVFLDRITNGGITILRRIFFITVINYKNGATTVLPRLKMWLGVSALAMTFLYEKY